MLALSLSLLSLAGLGRSISPTSYNCTQLNIPVNITTEVANINLPTPSNQSDVTSLFTNLATVSFNASSLIDGEATIEGTKYDIWALLCLPAGFMNGGTLEFAVHGVNFDHSYWNFGGEGSQYNYLETGLRSGHAVFIYDRLGTGHSSKPDGIKEIQLPTEVEVADRLIDHLRNGETGFKFGKVIGIGHSLGSIQLASLVARKGNALDALVLTGFSTDYTSLPISTAAFGFTIAADFNKTRFGSLGTEYVVSEGSQNDQMNFFKSPFYENWVFDLAVQTKQPATIGQFLTSFNALAPAEGFKGPVFVVTGSNDFIFCGGLCQRSFRGASNVLEAAKSLFPAASVYEVYVAEEAGHAINLHASAGAVYDVVQEWVKKHVG